MTSDKRTSIVPDLRFPEFRGAGDWHFQLLSDIAKPISDRVGTRTCVPMSVTTGVGLVSQEDKFGRIIAGDSYKNYIRLQTNDFAYNKSATKEFPQGYIARYADTKDAAVPNSIFTCFRPNTAAVIPEYLDHLFHGNYHGRWLRTYITVGARAHGALSVSDDDLFAMPVPFPPVKVSRDEQQKVADCLGSLDDLIGAEGRKLEALRQHKQGLMQQLFPEPGETMPRLRFPQFERAPQWSHRPLREFAEYENGKAYEKHIVDDGRFVVVNSRFISSDGRVRKYTNEAFCIAEAGDVLLVLSDLPSSKALARCFLVDSDDTYAVNQRVARLQPHSIVSQFLLYAIEKHPYLMAFSDGINQTHLSKGAVEDCPLFVPEDPAEQRSVADSIATLDQHVAAQIQYIDTLNQHKKALLQQLFPSPEEETP